MPKKSITMTVIIIGLMIFAFFFLFERDAQTESPAFKQDTAFVVEGEKVFLYGMYHVSWAGSRQDKLDALRRIAQAGFNFMHPALDTQDEEFLDLAHELGVYIIAGNDDDEGLPTTAETFKDHPAVLGWLIEDDFNSPSKDVQPEEIRTKHDIVKDITPHFLTYISGSQRGMEEYLGVSDVIGIQCYSVPSDSLFTTDRLLTRAASIRGSHDIALVANLQVWASPGKRPPTPLELRNMTYQALLNGVDGIFYYTYMDDIWTVEDHPELWEELIQLASELRELSPVILDGKLTKLPSDNIYLILGKWDYQDKTYWVIINTSDETLEDVTLPVSDDLIQPWLGDQPAAFSLQDNQLSVDIPPQEVYVFVQG